VILRSWAAYLAFAELAYRVDSLIDYLEAGDTLDEFLDNFPSVSRGRAIAALEEAKAVLTSPR